MKLSDYKFIIAFDLSSSNTGYSVFDLDENKFIDFGEIKNTKENTKTASSFFYENICNILREFTDKLSDNAECYFGDESPKRVLVIKEAMPLQMGRFTGIKTFVALAKIHGVLDIAIDNFYQADAFNADGIYPVSVRSLFRTEENPKPQKEDVRDVLLKIYGKNFGASKTYKGSLDISDSVALTHTLLNAIWNNEIKKQIKELRAKIKTLKLESAINKIQLNINQLKENLIELRK